MSETILSQENLNAMCENFEKMKYKAGNWWPTVEEINTKLAPVIREKMAFAIWILETAEPPQTDEEKESRKLLSRLVYENIEEETEEESEEEKH